ncbi:MAG: transcriptional regulator [Treponema sp.]|uniref:transcriptional regulator n=1 Tax=Treponema sp. TaxID=166 RepID=UPI001B3F8BD0|nr:transcriptional regulator [Treponema sp.]MBP3772993.1 transcriptional regulator [Treponema sp.]MBQ9281642.1 transcriptional regulator [Treponema sp.]
MSEYMITSETDDDFLKARHKALFNEVQHFLNPDEATLISLSDIKKLLKPENEFYKGMQTIPVKLIVGSEGRYNDFDNRFFPKSMHLKTRWEHIDMAHINDIPLPPISLYELGGLYFVRDGNHRVSVAKSKGIEFIDAEVVSLQSEIKLHPGDSLKKMTRQVINYEKRVFYSETGFGDVTDFWSLDFSVPGQYDVIYNHILTHKYYINMNKSDEIGMDKAMISWLLSVYLPVIKVIDRYHIMKYFRHRTKSDLYVWMIKYWDEIKNKFGSDLTLDDIAAPFMRDFGESPLKHFKNKLKGLLLKKKTKSKNKIKT